MTASSVSIQPLAWDSAFFGFPVARLNGGGAGALDAAVARLGADGTRLAYLEVDVCDAAMRARALALGGHHVGRRVELVTRQLPAALPDGVVLLGNAPGEEERRAVHALALASGELSRFRVDPGIGEQQFAALYGIWIDNGIAGRRGETVLVVRVDGRVGGMITISVAQDVGIIGLFAVDAAFRGRGLGGRLLRGALAWARQRGAAAVRVTTQGDNAGALAAYAATGFAVDRTSDTFHFWIEP